MSSRNEHKRHKHGHLPGDIGKAAKITMREGGVRSDTAALYGQKYAARLAKGYRKKLVDKSKSQQRQRDKKAIAVGVVERGEQNDRPVDGDLQERAVEKRMPFGGKVPNTKTRAAMLEAEDIVSARRARFATDDDPVDGVEKSSRERQH